MVGCSGFTASAGDEHLSPAKREAVLRIFRDNLRDEAGADPYRRGQLLFERHKYKEAQEQFASTKCENLPPASGLSPKEVRAQITKEIDRRLALAPRLHPEKDDAQASPRRARIREQRCPLGDRCPWR